MNRRLPSDDRRYNVNFIAVPKFGLQTVTLFHMSTLSVEWVRFLIYLFFGKIASVSFGVGRIIAEIPHFGSQLLNRLSFSGGGILQYENNPRGVEPSEDLCYAP